MKYLVNLYNVTLLFIVFLQSLLQSRAKSFLSAVYNEGFLYDSLLASQPSMPLSHAPCICFGGMEGWLAGCLSYRGGSLSTGFLKKFLPLRLLPCHLPIYSQIFFLDSCLSSFLCILSLPCLSCLYLYPSV